MSTLPRITIVTPSFNQAAFLEETIRSVLDQGYPNLQYGVVDGGSTDGSIEIIERYRDRLAFAIVERDRGQAEAINKGLRRADGDVVGWLCSDDLLLPGSLRAVGEAFAAAPQTNWLAGGCIMTDAGGTPTQTLKPRGDFTLSGLLLRSASRPFELPQPSVFWRRSLHDRLGLLREDLHYCMDFEWWLRLIRHGERPMLLDRPLAAYRLHEASKSCAQQAGFLREHLLVEPAYAAGLPLRERLAFHRRAGYCRRAVALAEPNTSPWRLVLRRPWWVLSGQVREAIRRAA